MSSLISGCAGKSVTPVQAGAAIPSEVSESFKSRFDVHDVSEAAPVPSPSPAPVTTKKRLHHRKHVKGEAAAPASPARNAFVIPNRRPPKDPIWVGEKLIYEITYFGMPAGEFTLEVLPFKEVNGRKVYHVRGVALSSSIFNLIYKLHDTIESFIDFEGLFSYRFHLQLDETKQSRDALELYDQEKHQTFYWNRWNHYQRGYLESKEYGQIEPWTQDSISSLFFVRTQPLTEGSVITFPVASEGKPWEAIVTVIRREMLDTPLGKIRTVVVKPETKFQGVLRKTGDSFMWLSDDDRHFLVRLEAKVKIGTVVGRLKKVESLGTPPPAE